MSQPLATCFITRYQHDKLYVDIAVEAAVDLRRRRLCRRRPEHDYFDDVDDIPTLLAERICYFYLDLIYCIDKIMYCVIE